MQGPYDPGHAAGNGPRLLLVGLAGFMFYLLEPSFHQHGPVPADMQADLGPRGLAASLSNLAGLSMLVLLGGFISTDRRRGYYRLFFAHPVSPLAFMDCAGRLHWGSRFWLL